MNKVIRIAIVFFVLASCKKTNTSTINFTLTFTDSAGVSHVFSDYSVSSGNGRYMDNGTNIGGNMPVCFISTASNGYYFSFFNLKLNAEFNDLIFSVPNLNNTDLMGTGLSNMPTVRIDGSSEYSTPFYNFTLNSTVNGNSGSFTISGFTQSGNPISVKGTFNNIVYL